MEMDTSQGVPPLSKESLSETKSSLEEKVKDTTEHSAQLARQEMVSSHDEGEVVDAEEQQMEGNGLNKSFNQRTRVPLRKAGAAASGGSGGRWGGRRRIHKMKSTFGVQVFILVFGFPAVIFSCCY